MMKEAGFRSPRIVMMDLCGDLGVIILHDYTISSGKRLIFDKIP